MSNNVNLGQALLLYLKSIVLNGNSTIGRHVSFPIYSSADNGQKIPDEYFSMIVIFTYNSMVWSAI